MSGNRTGGTFKSWREAGLPAIPGRMNAVVSREPGALWAIFLYRSHLPRRARPTDLAFLDQLRALPYEGAAFLRTIGTSGNILCWKEAALRPRDLEGLVERVSRVPAFARACSDLDILYERAVSLSMDRFGRRFDPRSKAIAAFGAGWRLGAVFLSLPWPLERRPWHLLSRDVLCLDWLGNQTAVVAKRERAPQGGRIGWGRRVVGPFEEIGGAAQEYPILATCRPLHVLRAVLSAVETVKKKHDGIPGLAATLRRKHSSIPTLPQRPYG